MQYFKQDFQGNRSPISEDTYKDGVFMGEFDHVIRTTFMVVVRDKAGTMPPAHMTVERPVGRYCGQSMTGRH